MPAETEWTSDLSSSLKFMGAWSLPKPWASPGARWITMSCIAQLFAPSRRTKTSRQSLEAGCALQRQTLQSLLQPSFPSPRSLVLQLFSFASLKVGVGCPYLSWRVAVSPSSSLSCPAVVLKPGWMCLRAGWGKSTCPRKAGQPAKEPYQSLTCSDCK